MEVVPIGKFVGEATYKYDVPRQGRLFAGHPGKIVLNAGQNFEMALRDLDGFDRIWVIFQFHENEGWRPTTRPPVPAPGKDRIGTFASRSPYRPNSIGLSCVRLLKVDGLTLFVDEADLLNGTPILDIKPYIPMADSFPDARAGWVDDQERDRWNVQGTEFFLEQNQWLQERSGFDLLSFAQIQLAQGPDDGTRRRIQLEGNSGILAYRTFRIHFAVNRPEKSVTLQKILSGYSPNEINTPEDPYEDKEIHRSFVMNFKLP